MNLTTSLSYKSSWLVISSIGVSENRRQPLSRGTLVVDTSPPWHATRHAFEKQFATGLFWNKSLPLKGLWFSDLIFPVGSWSGQFKLKDWQALLTEWKLYSRMRLAQLQGRLSLSGNFALRENMISHSVSRSRTASSMGPRIHRGSPKCLGVIRCWFGLAYFQQCPQGCCDSPRFSNSYWETRMDVITLQSEHNLLPFPRYLLTPSMV